MLFRSNDTATTEIYTLWHTLSLHDALPISVAGQLAAAGLLVVPAGSDVLRFLPPYNVTKEEITKALRKVESIL